MKSYKWQVGLKYIMVDDLEFEALYNDKLLFIKVSRRNSKTNAAIKQIKKLIEEQRRK